MFSPYATARFVAQELKFQKPRDAGQVPRARKPSKDLQGDEKIICVTNTLAISPDE
jgi:hypothetical protein